MRRNIDKEVEDFIKSISDLWVDEALDGDETEEISVSAAGWVNFTFNTGIAITSSTSYDLLVTCETGFKSTLYCL